MLLFYWYSSRCSLLTKCDIFTKLISITKYHDYHDHCNTRQYKHLYG